MLITVSGMVGSGKSTAAKHLVELLASAGVEATSLRFRSLGVIPFGMFHVGAPLDKSARTTTATDKTGSRWTDFRAKPLTAKLTCGYLARMLAFRLFGLRKARSGWAVFDRYFYDNFVHYQLATPREQFYARVLRWLLPVPDLAILLVSAPETIAARRPEYAREYVWGAGRGYEQLSARFPELVEICTDPGQPVRDRLKTLLDDRLTRSRSRQREDAVKGAI